MAAIAVCISQYHPHLAVITDIYLRLSRIPYVLPRPATGDDTQGTVVLPYLSIWDWG